MEPDIIQKIINKIESAKIDSTPFDHAVIESFLPEDYAHSLSQEFNVRGDSKWHTYSNALEEKKTNNVWNDFEINTYKFFTILCSPAITGEISKKFKIKLSPDYGLHGGGQHVHGADGNLNPHLDYSLHPKLGSERRVNLIYYLTDNYEEYDGGHFGLWDNKSPDRPGSLVKEIAPKFNRLIIFNTSQNSWHGLSRKYNPEGTKFRKSLAMYYISKARKNALGHQRAKFAPRDDQLGNKSVEQDILNRLDPLNFSNAYISKKK